MEKASNWIFVVIEHFKCKLVFVSTEQLQCVVIKAILQWVHF